MSYPCPICAEPINVGDQVSYEISEGFCHAECLKGSPVVDGDGNEVAGEPQVSVWTQEDDEAMQDG